MTPWITNLFDSDTFMPHGQCFLWYPEVLWLHVVTDAVIAVAYFSIPVAIWYLLSKRGGAIPFKWVYAMFSAFIFLCGTTHILSIIVLWIPVYRLEDIIKMLTAGVSIATAILLLPLIPQLLEIFQELHKKEKNNT